MALIRQRCRSLLICLIGAAVLATIFCTSTILPGWFVVTSPSTPSPSSPHSFVNTAPKSGDDSSLFTPAVEETMAQPPSRSPRGMISRCPIPPTSFDPLPDNWTFFGKPSTVQSPCPTSGLNNQLTLIMAWAHCALERGVKALRWKDISCTPTGGKDNGTSYAVGSADYDYEWFRWSSFMRAPAVSTDGAVELCLSDHYTWSEHANLKTCSPFPPAYGSTAYWRARSLVQYRAGYWALARCFLRAVHRKAAWAVVEDPTDASDDAAFRDWNMCSAADGADFSVDDAGDDRRRNMAPGRFIAAHVRRGDYRGFCLGITKNSGACRFRVPPYLWMQKEGSMAVKSVASASCKGRSNIMAACYPPLETIVKHLRKLVSDSPSSQDEKADGTPIIAVIATNSPKAFAGIREGLTKGTTTTIAGGRRRRHLIVSAFRIWLDAVKRRLVRDAASSPRVLWPERIQELHAAGGTLVTAIPFTSTDAAVMDVVLLSMASDVVLNRYSTFSHSVVDTRFLSGMGRVSSVAGASQKHDGSGIGTDERIALSGLASLRNWNLTWW